MPAYYRKKLGAFIDESPAAITGTLQQAYAADGFVSQYSRQTEAWGTVVPMLQAQFQDLVTARPEAADWSLLLEYPLYRLRRRIDLVVLAGETVVVVECKVGAESFSAADRRQVEEYALDLRDFHAASHERPILPVLWSTGALHASDASPSTALLDAAVAPVAYVGVGGLGHYLESLPTSGTDGRTDAEAWDSSVYRPVPNVIEAATSIFAGHDVRSIANADADNLLTAAARLVDLIQEARGAGKRYLLLLTGVPGSGKTLAGLHVTHSATESDTVWKGDIVYLSGNTPLVTVLREALALDEATRTKRSLDSTRREVRARIQHISDFLQQGLSGDAPPHEHVIVFDEAQRAWDEEQGEKKFSRTASEPALLLELMARHPDWCACVCLVGGGQEINSGEEGVKGWGDALRKLDPDQQAQWTVFAPPDVIHGGASAGSFTLGTLPPRIEAHIDPDLQLRVPQRTYRSPSVSRWVDHILAGDEVAATSTARDLERYPLVVTRSLAQAKQWLRTQGRGERRYGLVASSGARRLRADGLGLLLHASAGADIAHWYLKPPGDIRSSFALEVPANEYTCQGLELDLACVCWGGDMLWDAEANSWAYFSLSGPRWNQVQDEGRRRFLENKYRVLLTRAREGLVLWIPQGDDTDPTRARGPLDATAAFLERCGAVPLGG